MRRTYRESWYSCILLKLNNSSRLNKGNHDRGGVWISDLIIKITISSIVIGLKTPISINSLAKLSSDSLLSDS